MKRQSTLHAFFSKDNLLDSDEEQEDQIWANESELIVKKKRGA